MQTREFLDQQKTPIVWDVGIRAKFNIVRPKFLWFEPSHCERLKEKSSLRVGSQWLVNLGDDCRIQLVITKMQGLCVVRIAHDTHETVFSHQQRNTVVIPLSLQNPVYQLQGVLILKRKDSVKVSGG